jgi:hypothetical protein
MSERRRVLRRKMRKSWKRRHKNINIYLIFIFIHKIRFGVVLSSFDSQPFLSPFTI